MEVEEKMPSKLCLSDSQVSKMPDLTSDCLDILNMMIRKNPEERSTIDDILNHPWMNLESFDSDINIRVIQEFQARKEFMVNQLNSC